MSESQLGEPRKVEIVGKDVTTLVTQLTTLLGNMNRFFELSMTSGGRLKVANIPVPIGESKESQENLVSAVIRIPTLLQELTTELKQTRELLAQYVESKPR